MAARWLRTACMGFFDDFGAIAKKVCIEAALVASADLDQIAGFDLKRDRSDWGAQLEFW